MTALPSLQDTRIGLIGLGYVGLPLAVEFGQHYPTVGFDIKPDRVAELRAGHDSTRETTPEELQAASQLSYTTDPADLAECNVYIVTVPTPIDRYKRPDLTPLERASETVGRLLKPGDVVIYESTVYPGCTEEICVPLLERESSLCYAATELPNWPPVGWNKTAESVATAAVSGDTLDAINVPGVTDTLCRKRSPLTLTPASDAAPGELIPAYETVGAQPSGRRTEAPEHVPAQTATTDAVALSSPGGPGSPPKTQPTGHFYVGYSPERINPGDREHRLTTIKKVTAGSTPEAACFVDALYNRIITAGTHLAPSIRVAEAAKVIENTQRDVNIALINELAMLFHRLNLDTEAVLAAAGSKWNFLPFRPGLVGGHCIGVDPYYLTHKAQEIGYHPAMILAGRRINDGMGAYVAQQVIKLMAQRDLPLRGARILILGLTFKENCPDLRNTRVIDIIDELQSFGALVDVHDPWVDAAEARAEYGIQMTPAPAQGIYQALILAVAHRQFRESGSRRLTRPWPAQGRVL